MSEQQEIIGELEAAGILEGIRWAYRSAISRVLADHSDSAGYNNTTLGVNRYVLFSDRLDRVFSCERYSLAPASDASHNLDLLHAELSDLDIATFPQIDPNIVRRDDLHGSHGWAFKDLRFLLSSCAFGKLKSLPWPQKSPTKRQMALQHNPEAIQASLFEGSIAGEVPGLLAIQSLEPILDLRTFVVAHTLDAVSNQAELAFGRARFNSDSSNAWHWREDLLTAPSSSAIGRKEVDYLPSGPSAVEDAPVRLRAKSDQKFDNEMIGE